MNFNEAFFCIRHPLLTAAAIYRRPQVSLEITAPPHTATWEEFPEMSIYDATRAMQKARRSVNKTGVPPDAWSKNDQMRMRAGAPPRGYPEHPSV